MKIDFTCHECSKSHGEFIPQKPTPVSSATVQGMSNMGCLWIEILVLL